MIPGSEDVVIRHGLSVDGASKLVRAYFSKLWPNCVFLEGEDGEYFVHEDEAVKVRIDRDGVENEHGFAHVLSLGLGELTVVVEPGDFAEKCRRELVGILGANLGF